MVAVHDGAEMLVGTMDHQTQMFGTLLHEVRKVRMAVNCLSTSAASSSQAVASTVDADDEDGAVEGDGTENKDDEDGERVHVALTGTSRKSGESAEEGEESREAHAAGLGTLVAPKPLGCITVPCPQLRGWKGKGVGKMQWET
jgi:hypothetical protein